jgi:serine/threonine protein kinase
MTAAAADPLLGRIVQERYRILRKLGDGGMGAVYEGEHVRIKRRVAIKVLHAQFAQNSEIVERFNREAQAATAIGHPNICEATDMGTFEDGTSYMVLEYLEGRDWADDLETQGPQPLGKTLHILRQVCGALQAAHDKGIVHRDMKPENVFLIERQGDPDFVKVVDFGISKMQTPGEDRALTQTGTALGTPYYMSPEQCQGKKDIDHRSDLYSLGVILFQALTGQVPFDDEAYPMLVLKICTQPPPSLLPFRPDLPPQLDTVLHHLLAKDPAHRYASCRDLSAALAPFADVEDDPSTAAANAPRTSDVPALAGHTPSGTAILGPSPSGSFGGITPMAQEAAVPEGTAPGDLGMAWILALLAFLVVMGGGVGVGLAVYLGRPSAATPAAVAQPAEAPEAEPPTAVPDDGDLDTGEASTRDFEVTTYALEILPRAVAGLESTVVRFDGQELAPPFSMAGLRRGSEHLLEVEAEGYAPFRQTFTATMSDATLRARLEPLEAEAAAPERPARARARRPRSPSPVAPPPPEAAPPAVSPPPRTRRTTTAPTRSRRTIVDPFETL